LASNKRERELARLRAERQAARRAAAEAARRKRRNQLVAVLAALAVVAVVAVVGLTVGGGDDDKDQLAQPSATPTASTEPGKCSYPEAGAPSKEVRGTPSADGPVKKGPTPVTLTTNRGEIALTLDAVKAPCTVNSFTFLAAQQYFDGTQCHRLTTEGIYVLQCGDPSASGSGGPGYQFGDENLTAFGKANATGQVIYPRGTVAMANAGPGTSGSQFFLVYKDSPLAPSYTPFGRITKGLELLDAVAKAGATPTGDGKPNQAVTLTKVTA